MAVVVEPSSRRLILDSAQVTAQELYRAWVDWVVLSDNAKYPAAFRVAGGDDLGSGRSIPGYFFLVNGWRVRPMEADHTLTVDGNLFVDGGGDPVVRTLGDWSVVVTLVVPVQAQAVNTGGAAGQVPTATQVAQQVRLELAQELLAILRTQTRVDAAL